MSDCPSCGGLIGRDCFNPGECAQITAQMAMDSQSEPAWQSRAISAEARVKVLEGALEEARDLLLERTHASPARSAGHNARLAIEAALSTPAADGETT